MPFRLLLALASVTLTIVALAWLSPDPLPTPAPETNTKAPIPATNAARPASCATAQPTTSEPSPSPPATPARRVADPDEEHADRVCLDVSIHTSTSAALVRGQAIDVECVPRDEETERRIREDNTLVHGNEDGPYWIDVPPSRALRIRARDPMSGRTTAWHTVAPLPVDAFMVPVRLYHDGPVRPMRGRVVSADDGTPIVGARVHTTYEVLVDGGTDSCNALAVADTTGSFAIDRAVMHEAVRIEAPGYATVDGAFPHVDDPDRPIEILLRRGATVTGTVVDASGQPIRWAILSAAPAIQSTTEVARFGAHTASYAACDTTGRFELSGLITGRSLAIRVLDTPEWAREELAAEPDAAARAILTRSIAPDFDARTGPLTTLVLEPAETRDVRLHVAEPLAITGRVVDAFGKPVGDVEVRLSTVVDRCSMPHPDGSFAFADVPPGVWTLQCFRPISCTRAVRCSPAVPIRLHRPADGLDVRLVIGGSSIQGVVRADDDTATLESRYVTAWDTADDRLWQESEVAPDGTFSLPSLAPGRYWLRVHGDVSSEALGPFATDGPPIVLRPDRARAIRGNLASPLTRDDAVVALSRSTGRDEYGWVDDDDDAEWDFAIGGLRPGTHDVIAYLRGDRIALAPSVVVRADRDTVIERPLRPEPACVLRIRVDGARSDCRLAVHAGRWGVTLPMVWLPAAETALGVYTDVIVPAGPLEVRVLAPNVDATLAMRRALAVPGRETALTIRLR